MQQTNVYAGAYRILLACAPPDAGIRRRDAVRPEHIVEFFGLLGGGQKDAGLDGSGRPVAQLAILPALTHYNISSSPALATAVTPFLDAPPQGRK